MKIGIFDSGLGGLFILKSIIKKLPQYDYLYLGDTKRVPYGSRSQDSIYQFTKEAVDYLFRNNCGLIILACNSASARALRRIQREYLPGRYPKRRVLGVIIPMVESVTNGKKIKRVGVLATASTVQSGVFKKEFRKVNPKIIVFEQAAPLLVPLIESGGTKWANPILKEYLKPLLIKRVEAILLGCTHYPILKSRVRKLVGKNTKVLSQGDVVPEKLKVYLKHHPDMEKKISKARRRVFAITEITPDFQKTAQKWFGKNIKLKLVKLF